MAADTLTTEIARLFPLQGQWTEADYFALPETNHIVELSNGKVVMPDMPTTSHQRAVLRLARLMSAHAEAHGLGEVSMAPLRVRLWPGKIREPDVVFMLAEHEDRITEDYWGVPDLAVEVISPRAPHSSGTEAADRGDKFLEYAQAGVGEYWLVDPAAGTIEVYRLLHHAYHLAGQWGRGQACRSEVMDGFTAPVDAVVGP
ncbi:MAG: Uma2 family endonuclease [Armatimonadetes bacterium]|nr:Uma2 family endonuclease [Armatimonadota bacterium]